MAAVTVFFSVTTLLGFWQFAYTAMRVAKRPDVVSVIVDVGGALMILMIVISGVWTWRLLRNSNAPFQKKPGLGLSI